MNNLPFITADSDDISEARLCPQCGHAFAPRRHSGGKPQQFCSSKCRRTFHADPQRRPTPPTPSHSLSPASVEYHPPAEIAPAASQVDSEEFDWSNKNDLVLPDQPAIALYWSVEGNLVLRQQDRLGDPDAVIIIASENVARFLDRLTSVLGVPSLPG